MTQNLMTSENKEARQSILAIPSIWMINNPIASSLLTFAIIIFGLLSFNNINQESSPSFQIDEIIIEASYPGATPKDIEQSIILTIEHQLRDNPNIDRINASAYEGHAEITLELIEGITPDTILAQIKTSIDGINSFPMEMETPTVSFVEEFDSIVEIGLHGVVSELQLYHQAIQLKQAMLSKLNLAKIDIQGAREPEIVIQLNHEKLRQYQLTLAQILTKLKASVSDIPAGSINTQGGEILIRTLGRKEITEQFSEINIIVESTGSPVTLAEIATISNSFKGQDKPFLVNNEPGLELKVYQNKNSKPVEISAEIQKFINDYQAEIPDSLTLTILQDASEPFSQRISLLTSNGLIGMFLVIFVLALFIDLRLAFWVSMGIPIAIVGTLGLMPLLNIPINMITLFAFVITLGVLVDDAVIVAENIYQKIQQGIAIDNALKEGVKEMALPVVFSVSTNIIAFVPLLFVPGELGVMYKPMTLLIFAIFFVSLIEALLILPLHLRYIDKPKRFSAISTLQSRCFSAFNYVKNTLYLRWLRTSCNNPITVIIIFLSLACLVFSWVYSGRVDSSFVPKVESTRIDAEVEFPVGTPLKEKTAIITFIEQAGIKAINSLNGRNDYKFRMQEIGSNSGSSTFMIVTDEQRDFTTKEFVDAWRINIGEVPGVKSIFFDYQVGPGGGKELVIELGHKDEKVLNSAVNELMDGLRRVSGITDIDSELMDGKLQYNLTLTPLGQKLGFTSDSLGQQVRLRFFGGEAIRQIVSGDEVKVRVMMARSQHYYADNLSQLIIIAPNNDTVELGQVANITTIKAPTSINRVDGIQLVEVTASILRQIANASLVLKTVEEDLLLNLTNKYPELDVELGGDARVESKVNTEILKGIGLAFALIFALLAIIFRNYFDALLVLLVIPFCVAAAALGHIVMGYPFSVMSLFGMIALSGLVINGSFVMLLKIKSLLKEGLDYKNAIAEAALNRFRPVVLTSMTTAVGLFPMLFETSTQALYLVPMVISLCFGSVFSIVTILVFSPAMFVLSEQFRVSVNKSYDQKQMSPTNLKYKEIENDAI
jgi:multidrug efflux pump subunit AcrB